jgi:hypothetical protein
MSRNVVLSHLGKPIDIGALAAQNAKMISAGNAKVNARGDLLGPGGKIIKTKEQLMMEYNDKNPKAVERAVSLNTPVREMLNPNAVQPVPAPELVVVKETPKSDIETLKKYDVGAIVDESKEVPTKKAKK